MIVYDPSLIGSASVKFGCSVNNFICPMPQEKYFKLSHFVPNGHPQVHPGMSDEVREMMPYLINRSPKGWTKIPEYTHLEVFADRKVTVPLIAFRKNGKEVFVHVFCNEFINPIYAVPLVVGLYSKFKLGEPTFAPDQLNWIHSVPMPGQDLNQKEIILTHQIAQSLFWTIYVDYRSRARR
jgi:hypothetical protein